MHPHIKITASKPCKISARTVDNFSLSFVISSLELNSFSSSDDTCVSASANRSRRASSSLRRSPSPASLDGALVDVDDPLDRGGELASLETGGVGDLSVGVGDLSDGVGDLCGDLLVSPDAVGDDLLVVCKKYTQY